MTGRDGTEAPGVLALGPDYVQHPHDLYRRLREEGPVTQVRMPGGEVTWLVTRYQDVREVLADPRFRKDLRVLAQMPGHEPPGQEASVSKAISANMLQRDPPDHTRLRRLVSREFTPRRIEALRPRISEITAGLLDAMERAAAAGPVNLIEALAFPLPVTVICELLGMPPGDRDAFREWTRVLVGTPDVTEETWLVAAGELFAYSTALVASKRDRPGDDLLSALARARDEEDRLGEDELLSMIFLLLVAGHETTVNLIGNGMAALLAHPAELARLRGDPGLTGRAVEELLRYAGPVNHATFRFAAEPAEIAGTAISAGDLVLAAVSSANRDPGRFPGPDALDLGRDTGGHLAFGHGIHYCLGAPLARIEGEIAFRGLLERFSGIELAVPAADLRYGPGTLIRGLTALPVRLTPASS